MYLVSEFVLHARMSALSEGHLAAVIFCVLGDLLLFCWEDFSSFSLFPPFLPFFPFFRIFGLLVREIPVLGGGLIFGLVLY